MSCASPLSVPANGSISGSTTGLLNNYRATNNNGCLAPQAAAPDVVYELVVPARSFVNVSAVATWDMVLNAVRAPTSNCGQLVNGVSSGMVCDASSDGTSGTETLRVVNGSSSPVSWFLIIDGYTASDSGAFTLTTELAAMPTGTDEIEPNDTRVLADATGQTLTLGTPMIGELGKSEADLFKIVVAQAGVLRLDAQSLDCGRLNSTQLAVLDASAAVLKTELSTSTVACRTLLMQVEPGTYYVQLARTATVTFVASYWLNASLITARGVEAEPNDSTNQAGLLTGTPVVMCGALASAGDLSDHFIFTVQQNEAMHAEIIESTSSSTTCESNALDSKLDLLSGAGILIQSDSVSGRGNCSRLEANLTPGTWVLRVSEASTARSGFPYCLALRRY